ncbi:ABC transporter permease [Adhaeribacter radiodurans]|uniref:ABC transporter permease n=1 Tax=Adhaeribacter radiodurans TaxID=2745197 RepID=A0A7L7LCU8_9BACT|nr:ABC transporter permease [Adhaeribacter radiodurans]QMU30641.1 ABC transporter permease [Adhaeribacter radiodurans]
MIEENATRRRGANWRWQEKLAAGYLFIFLLIGLVGPQSGWLPDPNKINLAQANTPPFSFSTILNNEAINWLGTDLLGRDVLANLVTGAQTALLVSVPAMLLATIIGIALGSLAGFWGNTGFQVSLVSLAVSVLVLLAGIYYGFYIQQLSWMHAFQTGSGAILKQFGYLLLIFSTISILGWLMVKVLKRFGLQKKVNLPVDQLILKLIEIIGSVPRLLLVMCLAAFAQPALMNIVLLATLTYWTSIARLVRSELLQIRELPYVQAARAVGLSEKRILFREALPNALPPVIVAVAFGLGSLMSLEATLSFLNIGVPADIASWGRMMKGIQANYQAWWLLFFPALTLCSTILSLQVLAQRMLVKIDPARNN